MDLHLSDSERSFVLHLLENTLGDLRVEVRRTRTPDFHDRLQDEEKLVRGLIERLQQAA